MEEKGSTNTVLLIIILLILVGGLVWWFSTRDTVERIEQENGSGVELDLDIEGGAEDTEGGGAESPTY